MATLEIMSGAGAGIRYDVASGQTVLGRDHFCDVVLPVRSISRQHARIIEEHGQYYLEDLHSLNGTFVNGRRIAARTRLKHLDQIQIYEVLLAFRDGPAEVGDTASMAPAPTFTPPVVAEKDANLRATLIVGALPPDQDSADLSSQARLHAVLEIIRNLGQTLEPEIFLPNVLDSLFQIFNQADRGYILLAEPPDGRLVPLAVKHSRGDTGNSMTLGPISRAVAERVMAAGEALLSTHAGSGGGSIHDVDSCSTMSVPLMGPSRKPQGILHLDTNDRQRPFVHEDLEVLLSVGAVAGQAVEYARIHAAALELDRRERELVTAREVQLHFLPHRRPQLPSYRFFDYYRAAEDVGGDYFGYIPLTDGRLAIALGDVSGKGVSAALLMARLCSEVRYCLAVAATPAEAIDHLNKELVSASLNDRFVTFLLCVLDPARHEMTIVNAGHLPPLRRRGGLVERLAQAEAGSPLGLDAEQRYATAVVSLEEQDTIVMYTDGISEAANPQDAIYGGHRVQRLVTNAPSECQQLGEHLLADVERFMSGCPQSDDICLVTFTREKGVGSR